MSKAVSYVIQLTVRDGQLDAFKTLAKELVASARAESGTTDYDCYISEDGSKVHIYERYAESAAAMLHLEGFGKTFAERFLACVEITGLDVYGKPSDDVCKALDAFGGKFFGPLAGFAR